MAATTLSLSLSSTPALWSLSPKAKTKPPSPCSPLDSDWLWPLVRQHTGVMPLPLTRMGTSSSSLLPFLQLSVYLTTLLLSRGLLFLGASLHMPPSQTVCGLHRIWAMAITIFIFDMRELVSRDLQGPELITVWIKNSQATSPFSEICLISLAGLASGKPEPAEMLGLKGLSVRDWVEYLLCILQSALCPIYA